MNILCMHCMQTHHQQMLHCKSCLIFIDQKVAPKSIRSFLWLETKSSCPENRMIIASTNNTDKIPLDTNKGQSVSPTYLMSTGTWGLVVAVTSVWICWKLRTPRSLDLKTWVWKTGKCAVNLHYVRKLSDSSTEDNMAVVLPFSNKTSKPASQGYAVSL